MTSNRWGPPDLRETRTYFDVIRSEDETTFQTFDDSAQKRGYLARIMYGTGHAPQLAALNETGAGVFASVNPMHPGGRSAAHLMCIDTVFADFDNGAPSNIPLEPTLRAQSSIGVDGLVKEQWSWRLVGDETLTRDQQKGIMAGLVGHGADPRATDATRVCRLPGFYHCKGEPQMVRIIGGTGRRVHAADLIKAYHVPPPARPHVVLPRIDVSDRYLAGTVRGLVQELGAAQEGTRNSTLNWAAYRLSKLGCGVDQVEGLLLPTALAIGLGEAEARRTIASGATAGLQRSMGGAA